MADRSPPTPDPPRPALYSTGPETGGEAGPHERLASGESEMSAQASASSHEESDEEIRHQSGCLARAASTTRPTPAEEVRRVGDWRKRGGRRRRRSKSRRSEDVATGEIATKRSNMKNDHGEGEGVCV